MKSDTASPSSHIQSLLSDLAGTKAALEAAQAYLDVLEMRKGQSTVSASINGRSVPLTCLNKNYDPVVVVENDALRQQIIIVQKRYIQSVESKIEGIKFQIKQKVKEL